MFQQLKNIDRAFTHVRLFSLALIIACTCITCYLTFTAFQAVERERSRIYVLSGGKIMEALASTRGENIPAEAKDHVTEFHRLFFSFSPDYKSIERNIGKALYLADRSAKDQYDNLKEAGYYAGAINANISQEITADSIQLDMSSHPYRFRYYGHQKIDRPTVTIIRRLITEGTLRNIERTENNSHGLLIERWTIINNADESSKPR
ncbi:conjugative transposon protein TraK [Chitinophaga sp. XS-30]|uniref:conjugative transposon protein TraK n=1 Tax=Chitinophaga sp. XS-30 TaxID=2604421 RepID=UPI0011DD1C09|nr:conjugative transposon protein TraK [Chitinophaga sp. XS-30]QEH39432.1 conjugative transposon protein TraK [Chitinophaga sp. XS-30]